MARHDSFKLSDVDDGYCYTANCQSCLRHVRISLVRVRLLLGDDFLVSEVRSRLKCRTCGSKAIVVGLFGPDQNHGGLAKLFELPLA
jgi:hypothetical protein